MTGGEVPFALAYGAGLVASINPCGFAILPSLLFYYLGTESSQKGTLARTADGLIVGLVLSAGFMLVFGLAGIMLGAGMRAVVQIVPWLAVAMGVAFIVLGGWLVAGRHVSMPMPGLALGGGSGYASLFLFGVGYAIGSLSCTLPVFLLVVGAALTTGSVVETVAVFLTYGLGMATILMLLCLGTASFREVIAQRVRRSRRQLERTSGVLLLLGGGYVLYYWTSLLRGDIESPGVRLVQDLQRSAQVLVGSVGDRVWLLLGLGLAAAALVTLALRVARPASTPQRALPSDGRAGSDPG